MKKKQISDSVEAALKDTSLQDTVASLGEIALDAALDSSVLRDIPVIGSILGIGRAAITIKDRLFLNKLRYLLYEIESIPSHERQKMIDHINQSGDFRVTVGEKILYIVDRCEDHQAAGIIGKLFSAFLKGELNYSDFLSLSATVDRMMYTDLIDFASTTWDSIRLDEATTLIGSGLIDVDQLIVEVENQTDRKSSKPYVVTGTDLTASISRLGRVLRSAMTEHSTNVEPNTPGQPQGPPTHDNE